MSRTIDYYFAPQSPWTYLGHARFAALATAANAQVRVRPADFGAVFPASGGLPLQKRAPQRQAYRLVEMARFSRHLGIPMNLQPRFFPVAGDPAATLITAVDHHDGSDAAMRLSGAVFSALWVHERDIADPQVLARLLADCGLATARLDDAQSTAIQERYASHTQAALDAQVFGAPSYVLDGEIFWGQDRLAYLARALGIA